nr:hypothetical protein [Corynebacterium sp. HMSC062E11]
MKPTGNLVADTICRTAEIGLAITGAADAGPLTIIEARPVAVVGVCPVSDASFWYRCSGDSVLSCSG